MICAVFSASLLSACAMPAVQQTEENTAEEATVSAIPSEETAALEDGNTAEQDMSAYDIEEGVISGLSEEQMLAIRDQNKAIQGDVVNAQTATEKFTAALAAVDTTKQSPKAWIYIPETPVDLPLMQADLGEEADFYRTHDANGEAKQYGTAYIDYGNEPDFVDVNTVLRGSAANEEEAFYGLMAYGDDSYFQEHPYIYICKQGRVMEYRVFASFEDAETDILMEYNCYTDEGFDALFDSIFERRDMQMTLDEEMKENIAYDAVLLTLMATDVDTAGTCRYVFAVLTGTVEY